MMTSDPIEFALLGHPEGFEHLADLLLHSRPEYGRARLEKHRATFQAMFQWAPPYAAAEEIALTRPDGTVAQGRLYIATFLPDALGSPRSLARANRKVGDACKLAARASARIIGLGGFTSVVDGAQGRRLGNDLGVVTTSGNTLTAAITVSQIDSVADALGIPWPEIDVAVVGATGDIGRACSTAIARRTRRLVLIARNATRLEVLRTTLGEGVRCSTAIDDAYAARLIVTVTSASEPVIDEGHLRPGTIVLDVGYPKNVATAERTREDVVIAAGGLARLPYPLGLQRYTRLPCDDVMYGCFAETMLLALERRFESFSGGQGNISESAMTEILAIAQRHRFDAQLLPLGRIGAMRGLS